MAQTVGKRGFSVLAYPSSDAASLVSLSLIFKYHEDRAQATLSLLHSSVFLQGFDDAQTFILQYDADDIIPGTIPLKPAAIALPQTRFAEIARSRSPQIRTLFLRLKSCCQIWYPFTGSIAPKPGFEAPFIQLANLAKATELCILFDYGWLRPESHSIFQRLVEHPEQLSGFPVDRYYKGRFRRGDASIFNLLEDVDAAVETAATTDDEEPPPYVEASSKRPRHVSTSPASSSPNRKRVLLSPYLEHIPTSPDEKDITIASGTKPPCAPAALAPNFHEAVHDAVSKLLPSVLETLLPDLLAAPLSPSLSSLSASSQTSVPPPPLALSTLGTILSERVVLGLERKLGSICDRMLSHASYLRNTADVEFSEEVEDYRLDLIMAKEDCGADLDRVIADKLGGFKEECEAEEKQIGDRVEQTVDMAYDRVSEKIDALVNREREVLRRERGWLGWEREVFERDKRRSEGVGSNLERIRCIRRGTRAGSTPA